MACSSLRRAEGTARQNLPAVVSRWSVVRSGASRTAERLTSSVQASDMVARLGGDEFGALLPGLGSDQDIVLVIEAMPRSHA